jgi:hypothetical protein
MIDRTFLLFLRHENPSICILGVYHAVMVVVVMSVVVVVVDMLDCSVDTAELLHAYFLYVSAGRLFSKIPYHTPDKSQTSRELLKKLL